MRTKRWRGAIPEAIASRGVEHGRPGLSARRAAERSMRAFGRGRRRALLASVGAAAVALAASLASAGAAPAARFSPADQGRSLKAAPSLGEVGDESPLVAVFNAARAAGDGAASLALFASPKLDLTSIGEIAPVDNAAQGDRPEGANDWPGASTPPGRPPSRRRRRARYRKGQALKTIRRRDSPRRQLRLPYRLCRSRSRRRSSGSSLERISRTRSARATGALRAPRLRPSTPSATTRRCGSAKTA